jgi:ferredoxin/flavodoxin
MGNIVFYFSGTGNSLKVAMTIANELKNTEIVSMARPGNYSLEKQYDTIGFIYPTYFWGLPKKVIEFVKNLNLGNNKSVYYYAITTYGGNVGNALNQIYELFLNKHNIKLNLAKKLLMFPNYVLVYDMSKEIDRITKKSDEDLIPIINSIKSRENNKVNSLMRIFSFVNKSFIKKVSTMDKDYNVNNNCNACGICKEVCPVNNIEIINNKPQFNHSCENCIACIQFCPQKSINYKNATQNRRRYTSPGISYKELSEMNKN